MKKHVMVICLAFIVSSVFAQDLNTRGYIGIMLGPSFPYGSFASSGNYYDGYATTGMNINLLTFGYKVWKNFGISGSWFGIANPIDHYGTDGMWGVGAMMAGPSFSIPLGEKTKLDIRAMFGYVLETRKTDSHETVAANGDGYQFGIMLRQNIARRWSILLSLENLNTQLDIQPDKDPKVTLLNFSFGIARLLK